MATVIKKGLIGKNDIKFYSAASPTFYRTTSSGGATSVTAVGATHLPITTAAASFQFSVNNVNRAVNELGARSRAASIRFISTAASFKSSSASHKSSAATLNNMSAPYFYRYNKPELSYALYGATYVVSCPGSTTVPAEVYINGARYINKGTVLCDLSRTKTPAAATIGGLDRGPATATRPYYIYGVPAVSPTATRQWDLMASAGDPGTGPTAAATFPQWTWLSAVNMNSPVGIFRFSQNGDVVSNHSQSGMINRTNLTYGATWKDVPYSNIPVGSSSVDVDFYLEQSSRVTNALGFVYVLAHPKPAAATDKHALKIAGIHQTASPTAAMRQSNHVRTWFPVTSSRWICYRVLEPTSGTATFNLYCDYYGHKLQRSRYK